MVVLFAKKTFVNKKDKILIKKTFLNVYKIIEKWKEN